MPNLQKDVVKLEFTCSTPAKSALVFNRRGVIHGACADEWTFGAAVWAMLVVASVSFSATV